MAGVDRLGAHLGGRERDPAVPHPARLPGRPGGRAPRGAPRRQPPGRAAARGRRARDVGSRVRILRLSNGAHERAGRS
ncbi:Exodeoxyribonuclease V beta chain [Microbacterium sp. 8M]|nr:Exodeoxyribonuclease V beta chain [Microbacterium sp. 8M]